MKKKDFNTKMNPHGLNIQPYRRHIRDRRKKRMELFYK